jgi:translation elongation factor EF-Ts
MNEEQGLAQQSASMPSVKDVAMMLMQGMRPEELIEKGVPEQLVMAAVQMLKQQMPPQDNEAGLANTVVQGVTDGTMPTR